VLGISTAAAAQASAKIGQHSTNFVCDARAKHNVGLGSIRRAVDENKVGFDFT
jgi:hypothetical protein